MSRKKYINAYETVYEYDEDGRETRRVNYRGDIYEIVTDEVNIKKYKMTQIIIVVLVFLIQLALGFINNAGGRILYVSLPYLIAFLPMAYWFIAATRLPSEKKELRLEIVDLGFKRSKVMSLLIAIFSGIAILGAIVFLIFFSEGNILKDLLFLLGQLIVFTLALFAHLQSRKIIIRKIETDE